MGLMTRTLVFFLVVKALAYGFVLEETIMQTTTCTEPNEASTYSSQTDFNEQALAWHNYLRCLHGVSAMTLNSTLVADSLVWADKMSSAEVGFVHSDKADRHGAGENIAWRSGSTPSPAWHVVRGTYVTYNNFGYGGSWYCSECQLYDFDDGGYQSAAGHFTQIIWGASATLGCAASRREAAEGAASWTARTYVVCQYQPGGNGFYGGATVDDLISGYTYAGICPVPSII